jgi:hypothetical protein
VRLCIAQIAEKEQDVHTLRIKLKAYQMRHAAPCIYLLHKGTVVREWMRYHIRWLIRGKGTQENTSFSLLTCAVHRYKRVIYFDSGGEACLCSRTSFDRIRI